MGHDLGPANATGAAISAIGVSDRDRLIVVGDEAGGLHVRHVTSHKHVAEIDTGFGGPIVGSLITPKMDGILALGADGRWKTWSMDVGHPEATFRSLFGRIWYEGEPEPAFVYQSSSGDDAAEVKYNITPLIFGSLKSTVYAMLFAAPLAVLAAIFTSEFLHPRVRTFVKPVVEVMASLPSVVLGFVAALVIAPWVAERVPGFLLAFVTVPVGALLAGLIWQCTPVRVATRLSTGARLSALLAIVAGSIGAASAAGPIVERALFRPSHADMLALAGSVEPVAREEWPEWVGRHRQTLGPDDARRLKNVGLYFQNGQVVRPVGDVADPQIAARIARDNLDRASITQWLNGVIGSPLPGWIVLGFPLSVIALVIVRTALIDPWLRSFTAGLSRAGAGAFELAKFFAVIAGAGALAFVLAGVMTGLGLDARDSVMGAFTPRNSLIVGVAMGFAVIPIIYTISEDALSSVPDSLRSASLGSGATRWQTAIRVVVPVAMSGIFSALMIGLGRAVGETMIVLMATGNTPEMKWNIFSGFRALSANIAVELPEAPNHSTHYRVLFLCGLTLFAMTFAVNTLAELVRQRFRKRSASL
ncbi:MAG: ABC transporter permease subunit [Phycisphaerales bacterium]|nr:ABC transporter permease subunit [Phycisphaerales bacterium]